MILPDSIYSPSITENIKSMRQLAKVENRHMPVLTLQKDFGDRPMLMQTLNRLFENADN